MSRDQYDTRPPIFPSEEVRAHDAFMRIATQWFDVDENTVRNWLVFANERPVSALISNLRAVFTAGYVLGRRDGESI